MNSYIIFLTLHCKFVSKLGDALIAWFMHICYYVECREEFNDTCLKLLAFLDNKQTTNDLSKECISAMKDLLMCVTSKQDKLANYERLKLTNCMDAGTTSPSCY